MFALFSQPLTGRPDGFGTLEFRGSATEFELLYEYDRSKFEAPGGTHERAIDVQDVFPYSAAKAAGWKDRFDYIVEWHSPRLRQIKGGDVLVDVKYMTPYHKVVSFYWIPANLQKSGSSRFYDLSNAGTAFKQIDISNPTAQSGLELPSTAESLSIGENSTRFTKVETHEKTSSERKKIHVTISGSTAIGQIDSTTEIADPATTSDPTIFTTTTTQGDVTTTITATYQLNYTPLNLEIPVLKSYKIEAGSDWQKADYTFASETSALNSYCTYYSYPLDHIDFTGPATWEGNGASMTFSRRLRTGAHQKFGDQWLDTTFSLADNVSTVTSKLGGSGGGTQFCQTATTYSNSFTKEEVKLDGQLNATLTYVDAGGADGRAWSLKKVVYPNGYQESYTTTVNNDLTSEIKTGWTDQYSSGTTTSIHLNRFGELLSSNAATNDGASLSSVAVNTKTPWGAPLTATLLDGSKTTLAYNQTGVNWDQITQVTSPEQTNFVIGDRDWAGRPGSITTDYGEHFTADYSNPLLGKWTKTAGQDRPGYVLEHEVSGFGDFRRAKSTFGSITSELTSDADGSGSLTVDGVSKSITRDISGNLKTAASGLGARGITHTFGVGSFPGTSHSCLFTKDEQHTANDQSQTGAYLTTYFDSKGRTIGMVHPGPSGGTVTETWTYTDISQGNVAESVTYDPGAGPVLKPVTSTLSSDGSTITVKRGSSELYQIKRSAEDGAMVQTVSIKDDSTGGNSAVWTQLSKTSVNLTTHAATFTPFDLTACMVSVNSPAPDDSGNSVVTVASAATGDVTVTNLTQGLPTHIHGSEDGVPLDIDQLQFPEGIFKSASGQVAGSPVGIALDDHLELSSTTDLSGTRNFVHAWDNGGRKLTVNEPDGTQSNFSVSAVGDLALDDASGDLPMHATTDDTNGFKVTLNDNLKITTNAAGAVTRKNYGDSSASMEETVSRNTDGSVSAVTIGESSDTYDWSTEDQVTANLADGLNLTTKFYKIGPRKEVSQAGGFGDRRTFIYRRLSQIQEAHAEGPWAGVTVATPQDGLGRTGSITASGGVSLAFTLTYDGHSRPNGSICTLPGGSTFTATATYDPTLGEINGLTRQLSSHPVTTTTRVFNPSTKLLSSIVHQFGGDNSLGVYYGSTQAPQRYNGRYSNLGRFGANLVYDGHGQLQSYLPGGATAATVYNHDTRGNRQNPDGTLAVNALDQFTHRNLSAATRTVGVAGLTAPAAQILLFPTNADPVAASIVGPNGISFTADSGGAFLQARGVPASVALTVATAAEFTVRASVLDASGHVTAANEQPARAVIPPLHETLVYDKKGRLIQDAYWNYEWDGANRLTHLTSKGAPATPGTTGIDATYGYDADGRRTTKSVTTYLTSGDRILETSQILYAGCLPIYERHFKQLGSGDMPETERWFQWGPDRSGTFDGAAGIGGLMAIHEFSSTGLRTLLPIDDGLGNIVAVLDAATGARVATYEMGPFGEPLADSGDVDACPFRFQTRWYDPETKHYCFPHRFYDPRLGRWLSRDPIAEKGGFNLYAYCGNDPMNRCDPLGLAFDSTFPVVGSSVNDVARIENGQPQYRYGYYNGYYNGFCDWFTRTPTYFWGFPREQEMRFFNHNAMSGWNLAGQQQVIDGYNQQWNHEAGQIKGMVMDGLKQEALLTISGVMGNFAGMGMGSFCAAQRVNGLIGTVSSAMVGGAAGDLTYQASEIALGDQHSINFGQTLVAMGTSGLLSSFIHPFMGTEPVQESSSASPARQWASQPPDSFKAPGGNTWIYKTSPAMPLAPNSGIRERVLANIAANRAATWNIGQGLTTMDLRALTTNAANEVDALGFAAFTAGQQRALINHPNLEAAFRGSAIDKRVRIDVQNDPFQRRLQGSPNQGADFIDPATGKWWDMTTPEQWPAHVQKYGPGGTLLPTR